MEIKFKKIDNPDLKIYNSQTNIRRRKIIKGGFDKIVYATDQD